MLSRKNCQRRSSGEHLKYSTDGDLRRRLLERVFPSMKPVPRSSRPACIRCDLPMTAALADRIAEVFPPTGSTAC